MKGPEYENNVELEKLVHDSFRNIWGRLSAAAVQKGTSIGAVATESGLSASAIYHAMRYCASSKLGYTDTLLSNVVTLAKQLDVDMDDLLKEEDLQAESPCIIDRLCPLIEPLSESDLEEIKQDLVHRLQE